MLVVLMTAQNRVEAQQQGKSIFETQYSCKAAGTEGSLGKQDLTVFDFTIGASTIRDVRKHFSDIRAAKLTHEEEAEEGICIKNNKGMAVVFATGVMGAPDTITAIYLAPTRLVEKGGLTCRIVNSEGKQFATAGGLSVGSTSAQVSKLLRTNIGPSGPFCAAYNIPSERGPLQLSKDGKTGGHDFTGAEGYMRNGKLEWLKVFGIASD